jgi:hypothetical protein
MLQSCGKLSLRHCESSNADSCPPGTSCKWNLQSLQKFSVFLIFDEKALLGIERRTDKVRTQNNRAMHPTFGFGSFIGDILYMLVQFQFILISF